jgi:hypothetical protein
MKPMSMIVLMMLLFSGAVSARGGQPSRGPDEGDEVRVTIAGKRSVCTLSGAGPDSIRVAGMKSGGQRSIALDDIEKLEVKAPRSRGSGALIGAGIGGAIGATIGLVYGLATWDDVDADCGDPWDACQNTTSSLRVVGIIGAVGIPCLLAGAIIGSAAPGSTWTEVEPRSGLDIGFGRDQALMVLYRLTF